MNICKYYVKGKCTNNDCKYEHKNNICRNYFFGNCLNNNCRYSHEHKHDNIKNFKVSKTSENPNRIKNTETFIPNYEQPSIRIKFNQYITNSNEVSIHNNMFYDKNLYDKLSSEINNDVYKSWHGDTHLIADDLHETDWKLKSKTFDYIIKQLCSYFGMTAGATRLNYYTDSYWKPYHHDAAALKPDKAKTQNITVGVSFGKMREISFESTHKNIKDRIKINFPLENGVVYSFGNKVNLDFRHGIPPIKLNEQIKSNNCNTGRISIIIWGFSNFL